MRRTVAKKSRPFWRVPLARICVCSQMKPESRKSGLRYFYRPHLTDKQLAKLLHYKYRGEDRSITHRLLLAPVYARLVTFLPLWLAPNTVTLVGFLLPVCAHALLLYYSPTLEDEVPRALYVFASFSLFTYMVLDNLDGKQARRTSSSSPLGQLFDHGCDALNVTVSGITLLACVRLKPPIIPFTLIYGLGHHMFYTAALEEYHTGCMILRELNGPNEGLLVLSFLELVTAIVGPSFWTVPRNPWPSFNHIIYGISFFPIVNSFAGNLYGIITHYRSRRVSLTGTAFTLFYHMIPIIACGVIQFTTAIVAPHVTQHFIVALLWQTGLFTYDSSTRIMLATLTHSPFPAIPRMLIPMAVVYATASFSEVFPGLLSLASIANIIYTCLFTSAVYSAWRTYCIVTQITEFLNIRCFSIHVTQQDNDAQQRERTD